MLLNSHKSVLISACLVGVDCRYDCSDLESEKIVNTYQINDAIKELLHLDINSDNIVLIPICPEQLGGLSTPRDESSFSRGNGEAVLKEKAKIVSINNKDVTESFLKGAKQSLKIAKITKAKIAVLKEKSPSCGVEYIFVGKKLSKGTGVTTAYLKQNGIEILSSKKLVQSIYDLSH